MTATYTVANIIDAFGFEYLVIVHAINDDVASVFTVMKDGDHSGVYRRVPAASLRNIRFAELLA